MGIKTKYFILLIAVVLSLRGKAQTERFCIANKGITASIIVDENDWKGVIRAAHDLGDDVRKVTGFSSQVRLLSSAMGIVYHRYCRWKPYHRGK